MAYVYFMCAGDTFTITKSDKTTMKTVIHGQVLSLHMKARGGVIDKNIYFLELWVESSFYNYRINGFYLYSIYTAVVNVKKISRGTSSVLLYA